MKNKAYTILVTSNRKGVTRAMTVSSAWLKASLAILSVLAIVGSAAVLDYVGLLLQTAENKRLKAESHQLRRQFRMVESKLDNLEKSLERVKSFSKKLRLITNVEDSDRTLRLALGPSAGAGRMDEDGNFKHGDINEHNLPEGESARGIASFRSSKTLEDALFLKKAPLDTENGELSLESGRDYGTLSIRIDKSVRDTQLTEQGVLALYDALSERQSLLNATPNIKPARGWFTSKFGYRLDPFTGKPQMHNGLDVAASPGTPVYAPADGVVSYVGYYSLPTLFFFLFYYSVCN